METVKNFASPPGGGVLTCILTCVLHFNFALISFALAPHVEYKEKDTKTKKLVGKEATELSPDKYGAAEWWLLLESLAEAM